MIESDNAAIQKIIMDKGLMDKDKNQVLSEIFNFVKNEIVFGFNSSYKLSINSILREKIGDSNNKARLFMALLMEMDIKCRIRGVLVDKKFISNILFNIGYWLLPNELVHSFVEVFYDNKWIRVEGIILDDLYVKGLQRTYRYREGALNAYGVNVDNIQKINYFWDGNDSFILKKSITKNLGIFETPELFYQFLGDKYDYSFIFKKFSRYRANSNIALIRLRAKDNKRNEIWDKIGDLKAENIGIN